MPSTDPTQQLIEHDAGHRHPVADCQWCPTTDRRWSEATRDLVAQQHYEITQRVQRGDVPIPWVELDAAVADEIRDEAGQLLDALAAAGLLADGMQDIHLRETVAKRDELRERLEATQEEAERLRGQVSYWSAMAGDRAQERDRLRAELEAVTATLRAAVPTAIADDTAADLAQQVAARVAELQRQPRPIVFGREVTAEQVAQFRAAWEAAQGQPLQVLPPDLPGPEVELYAVLPIDSDAICVDSAAARELAAELTEDDPSYRAYRLVPLSVTPPETAPECDECGGSGVVEDAGTWGDRTSTCRVCKGSGQATPPETAGGEQA